MGVIANAPPCYIVIKYKLNREMRHSMYFVISTVLR